MTSPYYVDPNREFHLFSSDKSPTWRRPQLAALGAALAQWSLADADPPLISIPTGVGKSAVALAAPFLVGARRTLVVVPSTGLRSQMAAQFRTQAVLRKIGALTCDASIIPSVREVKGKLENWDVLAGSDVVVGIPASLSPAHYRGAEPPTDLFDLIIVDEAHHAPAATWRAILEHFDSRALLLTATPHRRDRQRLPGRLVYYYPLRQALAEGLYQPIQPRILDIENSPSRDAIDQRIAAETISILDRNEHGNSQLLVRAGSRARARTLSELYESLGHSVPVLHSGLGRRRQEAVIDGLRRGEHRGVVIVGMLVEGFDLPSLRVAAYHDKHKSLQPTAQLLGRLARVSSEHPQPSVLVAARDVDVFPQLQGVIRALYAEDGDWAAVLPGLIDGLVEEELQDRRYASSFDPASEAVGLAEVHPLRRLVVLEIDASAQWQPAFADGEPVAEQAIAHLFAGQRILYVGTNAPRTTLIVITGRRTRPRWCNGDSLDSQEFDLHVVSYRRAPQVDRPDLLLLNASTARGRRALLAAADAAEVTHPADKARMQRAFDSLRRNSVSSVGVRSTYGATRGTPSYRMFAGSSIESGLRDADTARTALGHAMIQVTGEHGSFTAGVSTGKGKYWETRYTTLRLYEDFVSDFASRYWYPPSPPSGRLLPQIARGRTLRSWPGVDVLAVTLDHALVGGEWTVEGIGSLDSLQLVAGNCATQHGAPPSEEIGYLPLAVASGEADATQAVWTGEIGVAGDVRPTGEEAGVRRGFGRASTLSELLTEWPPTLFFCDGSTVTGSEFIPGQNVRLSLTRTSIRDADFSGVDITAETRATAARHGAGRSVHEWLEAWLIAAGGSTRRRWVLINDGPGEIADYIVIEQLGPARVRVELWHAKYAGGAAPSVRIGDIEVVAAQAIKSRRWPLDRGLWEELADRLSGESSPRLELVHGPSRTLEVLLGLQPRWRRLSLTVRRPSIDAHIAIVQPGLSKALLEDRLASEDAASIQIAQILNVVHDAVSPVGSTEVIASP